MQCIDASHNFKATFIQQFKENQDENVSVDLYLQRSNSIFTHTLKDFRLFFTDPEIQNMIIDDNETLIFQAGEKMLKILGIDYKWSIAPVRGKQYGRLNRLLSEMTITEKPVRVKTSIPTQTFQSLYHGEIANSIDGNVVNIRSFTGPKKEVVTFLNNEYSRDQLKSFFKVEDVFKIYSDDSTTEQTWKTMQQLVDEGVITL